MTGGVAVTICLRSGFHRDSRRQSVNEVALRTLAEITGADAPECWYIAGVAQKTTRRPGLFGLGVAGAMLLIFKELALWMSYNNSWAVAQVLVP
ncbi:hypothetical protein BV22DRAFT_560834 [Leucogyrophana mollusca]|uniref:Uncharacterized protein n=1 Tax=Leucogyrophana mollusca TaxID=85980 RepID=A0ACB8BG59_9AGAM|nr:hypothetical protein BV22DRAFT_560834 [Leucogyrophana mollusca]